MTLYPPLADYLSDLRQETDQIPEQRKVLLDQLSAYIQRKLQKQEVVHLNFICTHNSRRSLISQVWATTLAAYFELGDVQVYSGGTEGTAFNPRAVAALERVGFQIENPGGENPHYQVSFSEDSPSFTCFSKTFDDPVNPEKGFAAIMTCSDADENCPFIPGAEWRLPLTYEDPKMADDTPEEQQRYDERVRQIGRELFYALSQVEG